MEIEHPGSVSIAVGETQFFFLDTWFIDDDGDLLTFDAQPVKEENYVQVSVSNGRLILTGLKEGKTVVALSANDGKAGWVSTELTAEVTPAVSSAVSPTYMRSKPNPVIAETTIEYSLQKDCAVQMRLYDSSGRLLRTLVDENKLAGMHELAVNLSDLQSGIYFYSIKTNGMMETNVLIKQ